MVTTRWHPDSRLLAYQDPLVTDEFSGIMFSAIMDDRTTDICASLDGKIWPSEDAAPVGIPAHHMCRSTWIPVQTSEVKEKGYAPAPEVVLSENLNSKQLDAALKTAKKFGSM